MKRTNVKEPLSAQVVRKVNKKDKKDAMPSEYDGTGQTVSTGSTLLDLAISGGRFHKGGMPTGILVEIFGPSGAGKTVMLSQLAGNIQRQGGSVMFHDPEGRLDKQFVRMFGLDMKQVEYTQPDTVTEVFKSVRKWIPEDPEKVGLRIVCADSLAALSTNMEMDNDEGDKMGMRRAKEFSEQLRKTCRVISQSGALIVCSNQIRQNLDAGPYGAKYKSPGGEAIGFYSSLRLKCSSPGRLKIDRDIHGKKTSRTIGIKVTVDVFKSSVWKPYHSAEVYILFDYGIDDIRGNLRFIKETLRCKGYMLGDRRLGTGIEGAIQIVEQEGLEEELKEEVIRLWNEVEKAFETSRKPRMMK